jgi:hypothetical protein
MNVCMKRSIAPLMAGGLLALASAQNSGAATDDDAGVLGQSLTVIGLTSDGALVRFRSNRPGHAGQIGWVTGLQPADAQLIGIDFRVQDGLLYGVGSGGGVYTLNTGTGVATFVNSLNDGVTPIVLSGTSFGVDFNPSADRLRIVSDTGQNLRHNVNAGGVTIDDSQGGLTPLTYTTPPAAPVAALGVTGSAYTNNDLALSTESTATALFAIDATMDQVVIQAPPNNGILGQTGKLGVDVDPAAVGFDIYSTLVDGATVSNRGFASLSVGGVSKFYRIDVLTGAATSIGMFQRAVVDIAVPLGQ